MVKDDDGMAESSNQNIKRIQQKIERDFDTVIIHRKSENFIENIIFDFGF